MIKPKQFSALEMFSEQTPNREVFVQDELLDWGSEERAESGPLSRITLPPPPLYPMHSPGITGLERLGLCMHCARTEGREPNGSAPKWACIRLFLLCIDHDNRKIANTNIKEGRNTITDFQSTSKFKSSELMRQKTKDMDHFSRRETPGGNSCTYCYMTFFFLIFRKETTQWEQESPSYVVLRKAMPLHKSAAWPLSYPTSKSSTNKHIMLKVKQDTSQWRGHVLEYWSWLWFFDCDTKAQTDNS